MSRFDLSTPLGRAKTYADFLWRDHAWIRLAYTNTHRVSPELIRSGQPWPHQLRAWRDRGVKTVLNLRGEPHKSHHVLEADACARLGLHLIDLVVYSREAPTRDQVLAAKATFETMAYPCLMHCKSGADRAGLMSVLYAHFRLGAPIRQALGQLALRYGHVRQGYTGVIDYAFQRYLDEGEPRGESFLQWVSRPDYDPAEIKATFRGQWWGTLLSETVLRRE